MDLALQDKTAILNQAANIHDEMEDGMDEAGLTSSMLQDPNLTQGSVTPQQWEQIKKILTQAQTGISNMTKNLPSSARSN
jgi:hypothetical protein